jgi:hypothetical protein
MSARLPDRTEPEPPPAGSTEPRARGDGVPASARRAARAAALLVVLRRHWLFVIFVLGGTVLRGVTQAAYQPAIFGITDSYWYLEQSEALAPDELRPVGYSAFLSLLPLGWGLEVVTVVQHVLGVLAAVLLYVLLVRIGVRGWLAALASAPVLLDSYLLNVEHQILAESLFHVLLVSACAVLLWSQPLTVRPAAAVGILLAAAALTRPIGVVLILPALAATLLVTAPRRRLVVAGALLGAFAVPLGAYAVWFHSHHDVVGLSRTSGRYLYGRVVSIADCSRFTVPRGERVLCPDEPLGERLDPYAYMWVRRSPVNDVVPPPGKTQDEVAGTFARRVIRNQPLDYAELVIRDLVRTFTSPTKEDSSGDYRVAPWQFQDGFPTFYLGQICPPGPGAPRTYVIGCEQRERKTAEVIALYGHERGEANEGLTSLLRTYQRFGYVPGPVLLAALLLAVAAAAGLGPARRSGLRSAMLLLAGVALTIALASAVSSSFSWRYHLPQLFLLPPAAALAITALSGRRGRSR